MKRLTTLVLLGLTLGIGVAFAETPKLPEGSCTATYSLQPVAGHYVGVYDGVSDREGVACMPDRWLSSYGDQVRVKILVRVGDCWVLKESIRYLDDLGWFGGGEGKVPREVIYRGSWGDRTFYRRAQIIGFTRPSVRDHRGVQAFCGITYGARDFINSCWMVREHGSSNSSGDLKMHFLQIQNEGVVYPGPSRLVSNPKKYGIEFDGCGMAFCAGDIVRSKYNSAAKRIGVIQGLSEDPGYYNIRLDSGESTTVSESEIELSSENFEQ